MGKQAKVKTFKIAPGFRLVAYTSPEDGAMVLEFDGSPPDDPNCSKVRVYMNDALATEWVGLGNPRYINNENS